MVNVNKDAVKLFLENCDWNSINNLPEIDTMQVDSQETEVVEEEQEGLEAGFYEVDDSLVFVNEDQEIFEVFHDDEDNVFVYHEDYGLFQTFESEEGLVFEEMDTENVEVLDEDTEETEEE